MNRYVLMAVVIVLVGLPLTLLSLREFQDDATLPLDNLNRSVSGVLRKLPGVARVEVHRILKPTHRIIQLRDRPVISKETFAGELRKSGGPALSDEEIDRRYREYIAELNSFQEEQMELLRVLIQRHGLKRILVEGFTAQELPVYREKIAGLKELEANQIARLKNQLQEVRDVLNRAPSPEARSLESRIQELLADFQVRLIEMGAAGRLLIGGEIEEVRPIDDADALQRRDAIVRNVLQHGAVSLLLVDGELDLTDSINRLGGGKCEYLRVTTKRYQAVNGE